MPSIFFLIPHKLSGYTLQYIHCNFRSITTNCVFLVCLPVYLVFIVNRHSTALSVLEAFLNEIYYSWTKLTSYIRHEVIRSLHPSISQLFTVSYLTMVLKLQKYGISFRQFVTIVSS